jgi:ATP-binding cassette subfamily C protein CydC
MTQATPHAPPAQPLASPPVTYPPQTAHQHLRPDTPWRNLWHLLRPYAGWLALGVILSFLTIVGNTVLMATSGWFITTMGLAGLSGISVNYFTPAGIIRGMAIVRTAGRYGERYVTHEATFRLIEGLRQWLLQTLEPLAPAGLQKYRSGDLVGRILTDTKALENFYLLFLLPVTVAILACIIFPIVLSLYSATLAVVVLLVMVLGGFALPLLTLRLINAPAKAYVQDLAHLRTVGQDALQNPEELLVLGATPLMITRFNQVCTRLQTTERPQHIWQVIGQNLSGLLAQSMLLLVPILCAPLLARGILHPSEMVMLALGTVAAFEAIAPLPMAFYTLPSIAAAARRIFGLIPAADAARNIPKESNHTAPAVATNAPPHIDITDITFAYAPNTPPVLRDFNLSISAGEKIALVAPSGYGKSTLFNLLLDFWQPQQGQICLSGQDYQQLTGETIRKTFSCASQHIHMFQATIAQNLRIAKPDASAAELEHVCQIVGLHDYISQLPAGYNSYIGVTDQDNIPQDNNSSQQRTGLSGGQIRRLALARALLHPAPVLLLDEPGAGVDDHTHYHLMADLMQHNAHKTIMIASHDPRDLQWVDRVVQL